MPLPSPLRLPDGLPATPVPWVSPALYAVVAIAGGYAGLRGLGETQPLPFIAGLAALVALDWAERRRWPAGTPVAPGLVLLAVRAGLFLIVAGADGSGLSRVLFLLLPFGIYFVLGPVASATAAVLCLGGLVAAFQTAAPGWHERVEAVADVLMFTVGLVLAVAMASVAVEEQRQRSRLEASHARLRVYADQVAELSAAAERGRLARDIHDGLGHHLTAISVLLEKAEAFRERDGNIAVAAIADARHSARLALEEVRASVRTIRIDAEPFHLAAALKELARRSGERPVVVFDGEGDERRFDREALTALYRAAQEGVTNARRHSGASKVEILLRCDDDRAQLTVTDDGRGFADGAEGLGLTGMRERLDLVGGAVVVDTGRGAGTQLTATVPFRALS
ncbi:sensor histidine kinase [Glycomyces harbinensis]|uniref:Oxygen sensor histidine kinase NreB n=1 Tax=Glycomyces harbinensis TaxID=58114 RepID=A0A1G7BYE1_9ACTN|nr:sensor histidine kinase [Glycomyces harbinensis]SDE32104.1 Signal transduction histidine kinase [Glycomyces harbinensis]